MKYFIQQEKNYLAHHGIKGQKWGIRRYQNEDGTLTEEGKRRYSQMSQKELADFLYKEKKRQINEISGGKLKRFWKGGPRYLGENSKNVYEKYSKDKEEFEKSEEYKKFEKEIKKMDDLLVDGKIDEAEWDKRYRKLYADISKKSYTQGNTIARIIGGESIYGKNYIENFGKKIQMAELQDMGYDIKTSKWLVNKLLDTKDMRYDAKTNTYRSKNNLHLNDGWYA